jgi:hypothetical protein
MRISRARTFLTALLLGLVSAVPGQDARPPRAPEKPKAPDGPEGFAPPLFALMEALDTNKDGKLSADEIKAAPQSLKKLDRNKDGKLSAEEIGWPPAFPGFGGGRGRPPFGGPPFGGERGGRSLAERIMARDANGDGKVTKSELPKSMHFLIRLADRNEDGAIDKTEAERLARQLGLDSGPPGQPPVFKGGGRAGPGAGPGSPPGPGPGQP